MMKALWTDHTSSVKWHKVFGSEVLFKFGVFQHISNHGDPFVCQQVKLAKLDVMMHLFLTRLYQCLRLCSCGTKTQHSKNHHFVMTSSWEPQCHHDIIMRTPRIMGTPKVPCSRGL